MRAALLSAPAPVEEAPLAVVERPEPSPGPGQVGLRVLACGVCHTDLHVAEGDLAPHRSPVIPGHQIVGMVSAVGTGVDPRMIGSRVGVTWLAWACGVCAACRRGGENLCPNARFTGYDVDGGFADAAVAEAAFTVEIPARFDDVEAAPLLCAGVIGYRALRVAGVAPGERIGLFGFGASAHLALQVARAWACEVAVITRGAAHRVLATRLGAAWVGEPGDGPPEPLDRAIVFAPSGQVVAAALPAVRPGGVVAINAIALDGIPAMPYAAIYGERTLRSVANLTRRDAVEFLRLAAAIPVHVEIETFPLDAANQVLRKLKERTLRAAAVLRLAEPGGGSA
jgi:propanol-preferring alcohol dehydrogenase